MEESEANFKAKLTKFIEVMGIKDADVQADTHGECITVTEYVEKLTNDYYGERKGAS